MPLSDKHQAFIAQYRSDRNATRAYGAVYGTTGKSSDASARKLLAIPRIAAEIARLDAQTAERLQIDTDVVLLDALQVLTADANELIEHRVGCCRHCYGEGFGFQRTIGEYNAEFEQWSKDKADGKRNTPEDFPVKGGIGFDPRKPAKDDCPECAGAGRGRTILKDTRFLSATARRLYDGVKETQHGIEVKMRSRDAARETLMKHLGLYAADNEQKSTPLGEALKGFVEKLHADEAGKLTHAAPGLRVVKGGRG